MELLKKSAAAVLSALILISLFSFSGFAEDKSLPELYRDPYERTLCASRKGYWKEYPENSEKAVEAAVNKGADIVEIDIKKTADNIYVLMADETVTRTCCGTGEKTLVSELTFSEISELKLLEGEGGSLSKATDEKVPALEDIFKKDLNCMLLLDLKWEYRDDVLSLGEKYRITDKLIFMFCDADAEDIGQWKEETGKDLNTMAYFKGNVIFSAVSAVNNSSEAGCQGIYLATKVPYGVVFGKTVMGKAQGKIRAMANTAESELCGKLRQDTEVWWEDLISRGYSIILTDYVPELREYIDRSLEKREELKELYTRLVENWTLPDLNTDRYYDYKRAYNNAAAFSESLIKDKSSSNGDISTAIFELQKAYDDIIKDYGELKNGTAGITVTPARVVFAAAAVAAVAAAEIFVYKKKRKS